MKKILLYFLVLHLFASCTPDPLEIDIKQPESRLVIASQIVPATDYNPNEMLLVVVSKTFDALTKYDLDLSSGGFNFPVELLVTDVNVWLTNGTEKLLLTNLSPGIFVLDRLPGADYTDYLLEVTDMNGAVLTGATTQQLPMVPFASYSLNKATDNSYRFNYSFNDIPGVDNWYMISYYTKDSKRDTVPADKRADIDYIASRMLEQPLDFDILSDTEMNGGFYAAEKKVKVEQMDSMVVSLTNITKGYYDFLAARKKSGTLMNQLKGEVVNLPSNIVGGYGYFNMCKPDLRVVEPITQ